MPDTLEKKFYRIAEVGEMVGVPLSTLRFWEKQFPQACPERNAKGTRFYSPRTVENLYMIKYLLHEKGLKIEAAKQQLTHNSSGLSKRFMVIERLKKIRKKLLELENALISKV